MEKLANKWQSFVKNIIDHIWVRRIMDSSFVREVHTKIAPYASLILLVIWRISLVVWVIGIFSFLISLSGLGFMFSLGFWIGIRVLLYVLLAAWFSACSLLLGIGMIRRKKWAISFVVYLLVLSAAMLLISLIPVGLYSYKSYGSFGSGLFNLLITGVVTLLMLKNQTLFK